MFTFAPSDIMNCQLCSYRTRRPFLTGDSCGSVNLHDLCRLFQSTRISAWFKRNKIYLDVLTPYIMKPYNLVSGYQLFGDIYCLNLYLNLHRRMYDPPRRWSPRQNKDHSPEDQNVFSAIRTSNILCNKITLKVSVWKKFCKIFGVSTKCTSGNHWQIHYPHVSNPYKNSNFSYVIWKLRSCGMWRPII